MKPCPENPLKTGLQCYFNENQLQRLASVRLGIAGAGGLGSNIAMLLARSGIEKFVLIDRDKIELSNLTRQHYWPDQVGEKKVSALCGHLLNLNPSCQIKTCHLDLLNHDLIALLAQADIWIEALDDSIAKKIFVETALLQKKTVIAASGIAGYGGQPLQKRILGNLTVIGDFQSSVDHAPPLAPKVMQAAAMMADRALELILDEKQFYDKTL